MDKNTITEWVRTCPVCGNNVYHKNYNSLRMAVLYKKQCWNCRNKKQTITSKGSSNPMFGKHHSEKTRQKLREANLNKKASPESIEKMKKSLTGLKRNLETRKLQSENQMGDNNSFYGKKHTSQTKSIISYKISEKNRGVNNPFYGKTHTEFTRIKLRKNCLDRIKITGKFPAYNNIACDFFSFLNKELAINGLYALNEGGEKEIIGYSVDYYDIGLNLIIEWDERRHYNINGSLRKKDIERQGNILSSFNYNFYRIIEKDRIVYKVDNNELDMTGRLQEILNKFNDSYTAQIGGNNVINNNL